MIYTLKSLNSKVLRHWHKSLEREEEWEFWDNPMGDHISWADGTVLKCCRELQAPAGFISLLPPVLWDPAQPPASLLTAVSALEPQRTPWQQVVIAAMVCNRWASPPVCSLSGFKFLSSSWLNAPSGFVVRLGSRCPSSLGNVLWGWLRTFGLLQFSHQKHKAWSIPTSDSTHFQDWETSASQKRIF